AVFENRLGARQRHGVGNLVGHVFFDRGGLALRRLHHDAAFARADDGALAGERALLAVGLDALQIIDPLVFAAHRVQPLAPAADAEIADAAFDPGIDGRHVNRVAAAGAAGAESGEPIRVDVRARLQIAQRRADVLRLPFRHHPAALVAFAVAPAAIVEAETGVARGAELLEHHDVMLGVFETEKSRPLNNARIRFA